MAVQFYSYTGAEELFVVPNGVTSLTVDMAGGGGGLEGTQGFPTQTPLGGRLQATLTVTAGETIRIRVGKKGNAASFSTPGAATFYASAAGGTGTADGGGAGGGSSDIRRGGTADSFRVLVAGGGGGQAGGAGNPAANNQGGRALDTEATASSAATDGAAGGAGNGGGGGGGGWRGGAGGGASQSGQGGTNMAHSTQTSSVTSTAGYQTGDGYVSISWVSTSTRTDTFWHGTANDDQAFGSTVKKNQETAPATDSTTRMTWTSTTAAIRTAIPLATTSTATDTSSDNGWAFNNAGSDGLNATSLVRRKISAGVWNFQLYVNMLNNPALLATASATITARVYRVATGGGTRTSLFTATSAAQSYSAAGSVLATWSSASQPEIILQAGEVIHVGYTFSSAATQTLVIGGTSNTDLIVVLGSAGNRSGFQVPSPGIRDDNALSISNVGKGSSNTARAIAETKSLVGTGTSTYTKATVASKTFSLIGKGTTTFSRALAIPRSLTGTGTVTYTKATVASKTFNLTGLGTVTRMLALALTRNTTGTGTTSYTKSTLASKTFNLIGTGIATMTKTVQAQRTFNLIGTGTVTRQMAITQMRTAFGMGQITYAKSVNASKSFTLIGQGTVQRGGLIVAFLTRTVTGKGIVTEIHPVQANRTFSLVGQGKILTTGPNGSSITIPIDEIPDGGGGGNTYITPVIIFDD